MQPAGDFQSPLDLQQRHTPAKSGRDGMTRRITIRFSSSRNFEPSPTDRFNGVTASAATFSITWKCLACQLRNFALGCESHSAIRTESVTQASGRPCTAVRRNPAIMKSKSEQRNNASGPNSRTGCPLPARERVLEVLVRAGARKILRAHLCSPGDSLYHGPRALVHAPRPAPAHALRCRPAGSWVA